MPAISVRSDEKQGAVGIGPGSSEIEQSADTRQLGAVPRRSDIPDCTGQEKWPRRADSMSRGDQPSKAVRAASSSESSASSSDASDNAAPTVVGVKSMPD